MTPDISVIIATHNRAEYLDKVLASLGEQSLEGEKYEVIVVDNGSTDRTKEVVKAHANNIRNLVYLYEAKANLNQARNIGWQCANAEYIAYTDDDALITFTWLELICRIFFLGKGQIVGGKIQPIWEYPRPEWLHEKLLGALSLVNYSPVATVLTTKLPFGVNVSFQKHDLAAVGGFDPRLDRQGNKLLSGGESATIKKMMRQGKTVYYDPDICVSHHIQKARLTQSWFKKRYYWGGYSEALMWRILDEPTKWQCANRLGFYIYGFLRNPSHIFWLWRKTDNPDRFWFKCTVHARIGFIGGLFDRNK